MPQKIIRTPHVASGRAVKMREKSYKGLRPVEVNFRSGLWWAERQSERLIGVTSESRTDRVLHGLQVALHTTARTR